MGEAGGAKLGFRSLTLWTSKLMVNCTYVEDKLHQRYHSKYKCRAACTASAARAPTARPPLLLHLDSIPNSKHKPEKIFPVLRGYLQVINMPGAPKRLHQVFLDYSFDVSDAVESGKVVVVA